MVHTTANHPWLSADHGWLPASFLHVGEPVVQLDGATATVVAIHAVAGAADMWDLTVSNVHTFAVGVGKYVVHNNKVCQVTDRDLYRRGNTTSPKMDHVREGKDIPDGADMARNTDKVIVDGRERVMGQSTFEGMAPGKGIWRLPSGTNLGELGLRVINDEGDHWAVQPLEDMSKSAYKAALEQLNRLFTPSW